MLFEHNLPRNPYTQAALDGDTVVLLLIDCRMFSLVAEPAQCCQQYGAQRKPRPLGSELIS
jgi:hypothetical protein